MPDNLLSTMAGDIDIPRIPDESDTQFSHRVSYSALRFWIQAFCLDDGYGGSYGVSSSAIVRKSILWLRNLSDLYPSLIDWYYGNASIKDHLRQLLRVLADVQDLVITDDGLYRCAAEYDAIIGHGLHHR